MDNTTKKKSDLSYLLGESSKKHFCSDFDGLLFKKAPFFVGFRLVSLEDDEQKLEKYFCVLQAKARLRWPGEYSSSMSGRLISS